MGKTYLNGLKQGQMISKFFASADSDTIKQLFPLMDEGEDEIDFCRRMGYEYVVSQIETYEAEISKFHIGEIVRIGFMPNQLGVITRVSKDMAHRDIINILLVNGDTTCLQASECEKTDFNAIDLSLVFQKLHTAEGVMFDAES